MCSRPNTMNVRPLYTATALSYAANCALGAAVAARLIDTRGFRWLHHALYIATCTAGAAAVLGGWWGRARPANRRAALTLMPAAVPLAAIARMDARSPRHPLVALAAGPFIGSSRTRV